MSGGTISSNSLANDDASYRYGGGAFVGNYSTVTLSGGKINENYNVREGAGIYVGRYATVTVEGDMEISGNRMYMETYATCSGGGIYVYTYTNITISGNAQITGNTAKKGRGGGVYVYMSSTLSMTGGTVSGNTSGNYGGGIYFEQATVTYDSEISGGTISNNTAVYGGGVALGYSYAATNAPFLLTISGGTISGNTANLGGGVYTYCSYVAMSGSAVITENSATTYGGGIYADRYASEVWASGYEEPQDGYSVIVSGGSLCSNTAGTGGNDICTVEYYNNAASYHFPYIKLAAAQDMNSSSEDSAWLYEVSAGSWGGTGLVYESIDTKDEMTSIEYSSSYNHYRYYTFTADTNPVAQINSTVYTSVQAAVNAIAGGSQENGAEIVMIANSREDVVIPAQTDSGESFSATINLAGYELRGLMSSVITVSAGAALTLKDTQVNFDESGNMEITDAETGTGKITDGNGQALTLGSSECVCGGGVFVAGSFIFESGTITGNECSNVSTAANACGTAVYVASGGSFTMTGGEISGNGANSYNHTVCAVAAANSLESSATAQLKLTGGCITGNTGHGLTAAGQAEITLENFEISSNTAASYGGGVFLCDSASMVATDSKIIKNTASYGGGMSLYGANTVELYGTLIESNAASSDGGGIKVESSGTLTVGAGTVITGNASNSQGSLGGGGIQLYSTAGTLIMAGGQIYGNTSLDTYSANDLCISGKFCYADNEDSVDYRAAENMAVSGINSWQSIYTGVYYVGELDSAMGSDVKALSDMFASDGVTLNTRYYLTAADYTDSNIVAGVVQEYDESDSTAGCYSSVSAAVDAALTYSKQNGNADVTVELLCDTSDYIYYKNTLGSNVTLDLNGYTLTGRVAGGYVIYIQAGSFVLTDSSAFDESGELGYDSDYCVSGTGALVCDENNTDCRAVYVYTGVFEMKAGTISGFNLQSGSGAAVYVNSANNGSYSNNAATYKNDNSVSYNTFVFSGGTIKDCTASSGGGAIYVASADNSSKTYSGALKMSGGSIVNCTANQGGAMYLAFGSQYTKSYAEITGGVISSCTGNTSGGGIYYAGRGRSTYEARYDMVEIYGVTITGCAAGDYTTQSYAGGGIYAVHPATAVTYNDDNTQDGGSTGTNEVYGYFIIGDITGESETIIENNSAYYGGGIYFYTNYQGAAQFSAEIYNVTFTGNTAQHGGGLYSDITDLIMSGCTFSENSSSLSGASGMGAIVYGFAAVIEDCTFEKNTATIAGYGAGLRLYSRANNYGREDGKMTVRNCTFQDNEAAYGAGVRIDLAKSSQIPVVFENVSVLNNTAGLYGGGICFGDNTTDARRAVTLTGCTVSGNTARYGGGIATYAMMGIDLVLEDTTVSNNTTYSSGYGGGIYFYSRYSTSAYEYVQNKLTLLGSTQITDNFSSYNGGGVYISAASLIIGSGDGEDSVTISGNTVTSSGYNGGGIYMTSGSMTGCEFTMYSGTISNNSAYSGGGAYLYSSDSTGIRITANIYDGTFSANTADNMGGALFISGYQNASYTSYLAPSVNITGGLFTGNTALSGGAIYMHYQSTDVNVSGTAVITGNTATSYGGGVYLQSYNTYFTLGDGGKIYGNKAALGQDVYGNYSASYKNSNLSLISASSMFEDGNEQGITATAWLYEMTGDTYTTALNFAPMTKIYALTLQYAMEAIVAVVNGVAYTSVQSAVDAINAGSTGSDTTIILVADPTECVTIPSGLSVTLNLNGYTLTGGGNSAITCYGNLEIIDEATSGTATADANGFYGTDENGDAAIVTAGSELEYANGGGTGTITGTTAIAGGGIYIDNGGQVTMKSGQIANCYAGGTTNSSSYGGGAVAIAAGTFTLEGGSLNNNSAIRGAAVTLMASSAKFVMTGGVIEENQAVSTASVTTGYGTICNNGGTVLISGGTIQNNHAGNQGGAIYNGSGTLTIAGTSADSPVIITGNTAGNTSGSDGSSQGGAIYVNAGTVRITNTQISSNCTISTKSASTTTKNGVAKGAGGAVYVNNGTVTLGDGTTITNNSAIRGGAVYQSGGTVTIMGAVITENTALMGGGVAQNPFPGNTTTKMNIVSGQIYGNSSTLTNTGNDIYSRYEGGSGTLEEYYAFLGNNTSVPYLTALGAADMGVDGVNVWKDDSYTGENRTAEYVTEGQFIIKSVKSSTNLTLTAEYYEVDVTSDYSSDKKISSVYISSMTDGTGVWDTGDDVAAAEISAEYMLENATNGVYTAADGTAYTVSESSSTYCDSTSYKNELNYISVSADGGDAVLYERTQAVSWSAGDDQDAYNYIVRSWDTVSYNLGYVCANTNEETSNEGSEEKTYRIWLTATLDCSTSEGTFTTIPLDSYILTESDGVQTLYGYFDITTSSDSITDTLRLVVSVYGLTDGTLIKPTFTMWVDGNTDNEQTPAESESATITVSAAPRYNIEIDYNSTLTYTGYFNLEAGVEVSSGEALDDNGDVKDGYIYGTVLGYGITLELYNSSNSKGLKGIEIPTDSLSFELSFKGALVTTESSSTDTTMSTDTTVLSEAAPYIWAYKENNTSEYGTALGGTKATVNMNWSDEDELTQTTHYAYNAAPYNTGSNSSSCYNGGGWSMTGSQPESTDTETTVTVTVSNYQFNTDTNPTKNSDGVTDTTLALSSVKAFSAGYVQVIYPIDTSLTTEETGDTEYVQILMRAAVSKLDVTSTSGKSPSDYIDSAGSEDLETLNKFFEADDSGDLTQSSYTYTTQDDSGAEVTETVTGGPWAVNEIRYDDNYSQMTTGFYVFDGDNGDWLWKLNHFYNTAGSTALTNDAGSGSTPIGSVVYMDGEMTFYSGTTDNSDYMDSLDSQYFSAIEYNYMTAMNMLQKFDADAYTPVGADAVVGQTYTVTSNTNLSIGNGAFLIKTDETALGTDATWANGEDPTLTFDLTILYAAKPDGSNWDNIDLSINGDAYEVTTTSSGTEKGGDGGVTDMDSYREENLIYFTTLDDLYDYFGYDEDGNPKGQCVAILYEFRNCCIRNGRSIYCKAQMNVTDDFEMTGETYCTTNDVHIWTTYRPYYKILYWNGVDKSEYLYNFTWTDYKYSDSSGVDVYGVALDEGTVFLTDSSNDSDDKYKTLYTVGTDADTDAVYEAFTAEPTYKLNFGTDADGKNGTLTTNRVTTYVDGYVKTTYSGGSIVSGSHNGAYSGNSLLLYTLDTSITLMVADTVGSGSNAVKTTYDVALGETTVNYTVTPDIDISSLVTNTLVNNGTQNTEITITLDIPDYLTYVTGSIEFDYSVCDYEDGDLQWTVSVVENSDGTQSVALTTYVSDVEKGLPSFGFSANIDTSNDYEVVGKTLTVTGSISAVYEETQTYAQQMHSSSASVQVTMSTADGISKTIYERLTEIGESFTYNLSYTNNTGVEKVLEFTDVLPYNGDGRSSVITGGYRVESIVITLDSESCALCDSYSLILKYMTGITRSENTEDQAALLDSFGGAESAADSGWGEITLSESDSAAYTLTYYPIGLIYYDYETAGIALFSNIWVADNGAVDITVTLSPLTADSGVLITGSSNSTQDDECIYYNDFFYRSANLTVSGGEAVISSFTTPAPSKAVSVKPISRVLSGTVWLDQNKDGLYDDGEEDVLKDIDVYLYTVTESIDSEGNTVYSPWLTVDSAGRLTDSTGNEVTLTDTGETDDSGYIIAELDSISISCIEIDGVLIPAALTDVLGNVVLPTATDSQGKYSFKNLRQGDYIVMFTDDAGSAYTLNDSGESGLRSFENLIVTNLDYKTLNNGNRSTAVSDGDALLGAVLYTSVSLPEKSAIQSSPYTSANWNLGLYYDSFDFIFSKTVYQADEDSTQFEFVLSLVMPTNNLGTAVTGEYDYVILNSDGTTASSGTLSVTDENSGDFSANFTMTHGQSVYVYGLPPGTQYTIAETLCPGYTAAYAVTTESEQLSKGLTAPSGTIEDADIYVQIVNFTGALLPGLGGAGTALIIFTAAVIMAFGVFFAIKSRKKRKAGA
ncbi:MAG: hypothetical protein LUH82_00405 [Clostridiales bacterium]|nr:hypothetical protein [Clostridiales bacterium]